MSSGKNFASSELAQYRLIVGSATEAVRLVRERFGTAARVLSVRQIEAGGLARFVRKPRLEVIVEVGVPDEMTTVGGAETPAEPEPCEAEAGDDSKRSEQMISRDGIDGSATGQKPGRAIAFLRAAGIDESVLERIRADDPDFDWTGSAAPEILGRLVVWLRRQFYHGARRPKGRRWVFLGPCGAGKTTALCKTLAHEVFVHGASAAVLKLDGEHPNATDGLAAFCDVCAAPLLRSAGEVEEFDAETFLLTDVPGMALDARSEHERMEQTLSVLGIDTRVLVVNAAWETEVIADAYEMGRACGATHVVFSHLDEVRRPGKLWRFALFGGLSPLAVCRGPSPAGEIDEDVFTALLSRSFPANLARVAEREEAAK